MRWLVGYANEVDYCRSIEGTNNKDSVGWSTCAVTLVATCFPNRLLAQRFLHQKCVIVGRCDYEGCDFVR